ncbi:unnamed protein product [Gadus morhua 'NCC']
MEEPEEDRENARTLRERKPPSSKQQPALLEAHQAPWRTMRRRCFRSVRQTHHQQLNLPHSSRVTSNHTRDPPSPIAAGPRQAQAGIQTDFLSLPSIPAYHPVNHST